MISDRLRTEAGLLTHAERVQYLCELLADHVQHTPDGPMRATQVLALRMLRMSASDLRKP